MTFRRTGSDYAQWGRNYKLCLLWHERLAVKLCHMAEKKSTHSSNICWALTTCWPKPKLLKPLSMLSGAQQVSLRQVALSVLSSVWKKIESANQAPPAQAVTGVARHEQSKCKARSRNLRCPARKQRRVKQRQVPPTWKMASVVSAIPVALSFSVGVVSRQPGEGVRGRCVSVASAKSLTPQAWPKTNGEEDREGPQRPRRKQGGRWAGGRGRKGACPGRGRGGPGAGPGAGCGCGPCAGGGGAAAASGWVRRAGGAGLLLRSACRPALESSGIFFFFFFGLNSFLSPERKLSWLCSGASPGVAGAAAARRGWGWASSPLSARVP